MHALDVGTGELLGAVGWGSGESYLEGAESVEHYSLAVGETVADLGFQGIDYCDDVWLGQGASLADLACNLLGVNNTVYYCSSIDLTFGLGVLAVVNYFSVLYAYSIKNLKG